RCAGPAFGRRYRAPARSRLSAEISQTTVWLGGRGVAISGQIERRPGKITGRMTKTDELTLAAEFPQANYEDWRKLVDGVLKGAPFEKLVSKTSDGLKIDPIYRRAQGATPVAGRAAAAPWQIMQRIDHPDAKAANAQALHDLENGATGLTLVFAGANGAHGF